MVRNEKYIPALRFGWLTPLYDPILRWVMREEQFKRQLLRQAKSVRVGAAISLDQGMAFLLPYPDQSFDRVLSSLLFHHLNTENKRRTLDEAYRVLRPGGELHLADFGRPHSTWAKWVSRLMARLEEASDNHKGLLPVMMHQAGFKLAEAEFHFSTLFGTLSIYGGQKPGN